MNQINNDALSKAAINYVLESDNYCSYYPEINGLDVIRLLRLDQLDFSNNSKYNVFDVYVYPVYKNINKLFYSFMKDNHIYVNGNDMFFFYLESLINFANSYNIPIIRYPAYKRTSDNYIVSKCNTDPRNPQKRFIQFVDLINPNFQNENYIEAYYFLNQLAHEIGHALDVMDFSKINNNIYKYQREIFAWGLADNILKQLNITDTEFEKQKRFSLRRYYKYYFKDR